MSREQVVIFTGGGTAGHVNPALEVIAHLRKEPSIKANWIGSKRGIERSIVTTEEIPYYAIPCGKLRRNVSLRNIRDIFLVIAGIVAAYVRLCRISPTLIFSKGGYVTVPVVIAAALLRIPVISHESDLVPGLATKINSRFSCLLCLAYAQSSRYLSEAVKKKSIVSGNPIRRCIQNGNKERARQFLELSEEQRRRPLVLFMGGSLGASEINGLVAEIGDTLISTVPNAPLIVHQYGHQHGATRETTRGPKRSAHNETTQTAEHESANRDGSVRVARALTDHPHYFHFPYIGEEMGDLLALADVVISRAGANALWECAYLKKAMILIPLYGSGSRGEQLLNAQLFAKHNGAILLQNARGSTLLEHIRALLVDSSKRALLGARAYELVTADAVATLSLLIVEKLPTRR